MKIFLQVFSVETLSVHFCARCEHNVKHNNLSPVRDWAYLCHKAAGLWFYWPWDRRCYSCWAGPWTLWGSTPSCWPCSSPDTTFIKLSSAGSEKINHFRITLQFNIDYSRPRVNIYSVHLATALITAASRPRGRLLVALGAGPRVRIPAHCCLISRDPGWYQAWPGLCSAALTLLLADWASLSSGSSDRLSSLAWVSRHPGPGSHQAGRRSLSPVCPTPHTRAAPPGPAPGRDVTIMRYQTAVRLHSPGLIVPAPRPHWFSHLIPVWYQNPIKRGQTMASSSPAPAAASSAVSLGAGTLSSHYIGAFADFG